MFSLQVYLVNDVVHSYTGIYMLLELAAKYISPVLEILPCLLKKAERCCQALKQNLRYCETNLETLRHH